MKVMRRIWTGLLLGCVCCTAAWAMDFSGMTNQELADLQGAVQNASQDEQVAFRQEWEKRQAAMTEEEKKLFAKPQAKTSGDDEKLEKPNIPGRGYEQQGVGTVIYGGEMVPGQGGGKGAGKK